MRVRDAMSKPLWLLPPSTSAADAVRAAREHGTCHAVIGRGSHVLGVACRFDLEQALADLPVGTQMTLPARFVSVDASLGDAEELMSRYGVGLLVVEADGEPVGALSRGDITRCEPEAHAEYRCIACGAAHHVRRNGNGVPLCGECRGAAREGVSGFDLGQVD